MRIGIISDTHGVLSPEVSYLLEDCEAILHAGDVGCIQIIEELERIAPVYVVRGNNDVGEWAVNLPKRVVMTLNGYKIFMVHDYKEYNGQRDYDIVISGHSHKLKISQEGRQLHINPGACGKKRFNLPLTLIKMNLDLDKQISIHYL